jgi:hypothetical protein
VREAISQGSLLKDCQSMSPINHSLGSYIKDEASDDHGSADDVDNEVDDVVDDDDDNGNLSSCSDVATSTVSHADLNRCVHAKAVQDQVHVLQQQL